MRVREIWQLLEEYEPRKGFFRRNFHAHPAISALEALLAEKDPENEIEPERLVDWFFAQYAEHRWDLPGKQKKSYHVVALPVFRKVIPSVSVNHRLSQPRWFWDYDRLQRTFESLTAICPDPAVKIKLLGLIGLERFIVTFHRLTRIIQSCPVIVPQLFRAPQCLSLIRNYRDLFWVVVACGEFAVHLLRIPVFLGLLKTYDQIFSIIQVCPPAAGELLGDPERRKLITKSGQLFDIVKTAPICLHYLGDCFSRIGSVEGKPIERLGFALAKLVSQHSGDQENVDFLKGLLELIEPYRHSDVNHADLSRHLENFRDPFSCLAAAVFFGEIGVVQDGTPQKVIPQKAISIVLLIQDEKLDEPSKTFKKMLLFHLKQGLSCYVDSSPCPIAAEEERRGLILAKIVDVVLSVIRPEQAPLGIAAVFSKRSGCRVFLDCDDAVLTEAMRSEELTAWDYVIRVFPEVLLFLSSTLLKDMDLSVVFRAFEITKNASVGLIAWGVSPEHPEFLAEIRRNLGRLVGGERAFIAPVILWDKGLEQWRRLVGHPFVERVGHRIHLQAVAVGQEGNHPGISQSDKPSPNSCELGTAGLDEGELSALRQWVKNVLLEEFNPARGAPKGFSEETLRGDLLTGLVGPEFRHRYERAANRVMLRLTTVIGHQQLPMIAGVRDFLEWKVSGRLGIGAVLRGIQLTLEEALGGKQVVSKVSERPDIDDVLRGIQLVLGEELGKQVALCSFPGYCDDPTAFLKAAEADTSRDFMALQTCFQQGGWSSFILHEAGRLATLSSDTRHVRRFPGVSYGTEVRRESGVVLEVTQDSAFLGNGGPHRKQRRGSCVFLKRSPIESSELFFVSVAGDLSAAHLDNALLFGHQLSRFGLTNDGLYELSPEQWASLCRHIVGVRETDDPAAWHPSRYSFVNYAPRGQKKLFHIAETGMSTEIEIRDVQAFEARLDQWLGSSASIRISPKDFEDLFGEGAWPQQMAVFSQAWLDAIQVDALWEVCIEKMDSPSSLPSFQGAMSQLALVFNRLFESGLVLLQEHYRQYLAASLVGTQEQGKELAQYAEEMRSQGNVALEELREFFWLVYSDALRTRKALPFFREAAPLRWGTARLHRSFDQLYRLLEWAAWALEAEGFYRGHEEAGERQEQALRRAAQSHPAFREVPPLLRRALDAGHDSGGEPLTLKDLLKEFGDFNEISDSEGRSLLKLVQEQGDYVSFLRLLPSGICLLDSSVYAAVLKREHLDSNVAELIIDWGCFELDRMGNSREGRPQEHPLRMAERLAQLCEKQERIFPLISLQSQFMGDVESAIEAYKLKLRLSSKQPQSSLEDFEKNGECQRLRQMLHSARVAGHDTHLVACLEADPCEFERLSEEARDLRKKLKQLAQNTRRTSGYAVLSYPLLPNQEIGWLKMTLFELQRSAQLRRTGQAEHLEVLRKLASENSNLTDRIEQLRKEKSALKGEKAALENEKAAVEGKNVALARENTALENRISKLTVEAGDPAGAAGSLLFRSMGFCADDSADKGDPPAPM